MTTALIIFRCDLSIIDNLCIYDAIQHKHDNILFLLLINPEQFYLNNKNKNYFSEKARNFFALALINLNNEIYNITNKKNNLILLIEHNNNTLIDFCKKYSINSVYWNKLYSIYSLNRDSHNKQILEKNNIKVFENLNHYYITPIDHNKIYKVFSAFYKFYSKTKINNIKFNNEITSTKNITNINFYFCLMFLFQNLHPLNRHLVISMHCLDIFLIILL